MRNTIFRAAILLSAFFVCGTGLHAQEPASSESTAVSTVVETPDGRKVNKTNDFNARFCLATNLGDWAFFGTANLWAQFAVARHFTVEAVAKYNPWTFHEGESNQFQYRHQTYALGMRYWFWYTYSGWSVGAKAQYQEYNWGGLGSNAPLTEEGDRVGLAVDVQYTMQIASWFNVSFGVGAWGGVSKYTQYVCPRCGKVVDSGNKLFIRPNEVIISAQFIF